MEKLWCIGALSLLMLLAPPSEPARILGLFQLNIKSHFIMFEPLLKALAARGHQIDVVSHFPQQRPLPNYRDLSVEGSLPNVTNMFSVDVALGFASHMHSMHFFWLHNVNMCEEVYKHPVMQALLDSTEHYDLVLTELFGSDCMMAFGHKFNAPVVNVLTSVPFPWAGARVGNPENPAYVPVVFLPLRAPMHFAQRLANTVLLLAMKAGSYFVADALTDAMTRRYFREELPPLSVLQNNVSLVLANTHFSLHQPRPTVPAMVEVAGMHIREPRSLPKELKAFLDGATEGAIFFSLGSMVRSETLGPTQLRALLAVFANSKQRVLWKCDASQLGPLPDNVLTADWLPQSDILSHPNVRVFLTHGGLMGTLEAVHFGVPMLGMPFFGDQHINMHSYVSLGVALQINPRTFTQEQLQNSLDSLLNDPRFSDRARHLSRVFRDRPQPPLDAAVFWTEYVLRHRGAQHLRSAAVDMPLAQLLLLDVAAALAACCALLLAGLWFAAHALSEWRRGLQDASRPPVAAKVKTK